MGINYIKNIMINLQIYGLNDYFIKQITIEQQEFLAKVISVNKRSFKVITRLGIRNAIIKGSNIHFKDIVNNIPKVGDFVILEDLQENDDNFFITQILERNSVLKRTLVGKNNEDQIIATNIDYAFIFLPCDLQFNLKRIERIVIACNDGNIIPIILMSKTDVPLDLNDLINKTNAYFPNVQILKTSMFNKESIEEIQNLLKPNLTAVFIGNSGAGKSTLTNILLNEDIQKVKEVSNLEDKGQHTTTSRHLFLLPHGGAIIDTPGIKEFGINLDSSKALQQNFQDIQDIAISCKFSNCTHNNEPSCAVKQAITEGVLSQEKFNNFMKLSLENEESMQGKQEKKRNNKKKININAKEASKFKHNFKHTLD